MSALLRCIVRSSWERFSGILSPLAFSEMILIGSLSVVVFVGAIVIDVTRVLRTEFMVVSSVVLEVRARRAISRGSGN